MATKKPAEPQQAFLFVRCFVARRGGLGVFFNSPAIPERPFITA
ncbi:MAG TPA: hypothetical protein VLA96_10590 [Terriglobales bacterium]|nr:hypothetical protein [Terriglobales bacterium]